MMPTISVGTDVNNEVVSVRDMKALDGDEWPASVPGRFTPSGNQFQYPLSSSLGALGERKIS